MKNRYYPPQHEIIHFDTSVECISCNRKFTTYSGMIIHLESYKCESSVGIIHLNESAAKCYQWRKFVVEDYRCSMLQREDLSELYHEKVYPFHCPTCATVFSKLSGLFQHVESNACSQMMDEGAIAKFVRWLVNRHG